jgi:hypothetical protein
MTWFKYISELEIEGRFKYLLQVLSVLSDDYIMHIMQILFVLAFHQVYLLNLQVSPSTFCSFLLSLSCLEAFCFHSFIENQNFLKLFMLLIRVHWAPF